jgi:tetraacyldisaccharide 4'-kinase
MLQTAWLNRGWLALLLWPLTLLSRAWLLGVWLLYALRLKRPTKLPVTLLVVGNVMVGGTGKTPIVMHLASELKDLGFKVGVIARAQETAQQNVQEVYPHSPATQVGDEPLLVKKRSKVPVFIGKARVKAAQALLIPYDPVTSSATFASRFCFLQRWAECI